MYFLFKCCVSRHLLTRRQQRLQASFCNDSTSNITIEFLHNLTFSANSWQDPANIDIQWVATIECQYWQDPARNWQKLTNYAKTRLLFVQRNKMDSLHAHFKSSWVISRCMGNWTRTGTGNWTSTIGNKGFWFFSSSGTSVNISVQYKSLN